MLLTPIMQSMSLATVASEGCRTAGIHWLVVLVHDWISSHRNLAIPATPTTKPLSSEARDSFDDKLCTMSNAVVCAGLMTSGITWQSAGTGTVEP